MKGITVFSKLKLVPSIFTGKLSVWKKGPFILFLTSSMQIFKENECTIPRTTRLTSLHTSFTSIRIQ